MQAIDWLETSAHEAVDAGSPPDALRLLSRASALADMLATYYERHSALSLWLLNRRRTGERMSAGAATAGLMPPTSTPSTAGAETPTGVCSGSEQPAMNTGDAYPSRTAIDSAGSGMPGVGGHTHTEAGADEGDTSPQRMPSAAVPIVELARRVRWQACCAALCRDMEDTDGAVYHSLEARTTSPEWKQRLRNAKFAIDVVLLMEAA